MQRSYPLRWLALGIGFLATQCIESISDDCTKTLTCEDDDQPILMPDCVWRYSSDGREWEGGPEFDMTTGKWRWPDGKETDTQTLMCRATDAGADAGSTGADCRLGTTCDDPLVCNYRTGACVECLNSDQCSGNMAVGDAGAAIVCDEARQQCVPCLRNEHCTATGNALVCKVNLDDSTRNECVQCQDDSDCGGATPVCDETSNECTITCTTTEECGGEKPVCNQEKQVCVECQAPSDCRGSDTQCNTTSNQCVECVDDVPCSGAMEVCDATRNRCVQCRNDNQCTNNSNGTRCELQTNLCVQCLDDTQCSSVATSRCNLASNTCVGCTAHTQCENGLLCNPTLGGGTCVQCLTEPDCAGNPNGQRCESTSGRCVACLSTSECTSDSLARCQTEAGDSPLTQYTCVGCEEHSDCSGKGLPDLCNMVSHVCVNCLTNAECSQDRAKSLCQNGSCAVCSVDNDCDAIAGLNACLPNVGCVECVDADDCVGNPDGAVCKTSNAGQATGPAAVNTCVECQSNADCTSPTASVCSNNTCVPCAADPAPNTDGLDAACSHIRSGATVLGVCDAGACVQCTGPRRQACSNGTNVCNSTTKLCTQFPVGDADLCETCVSDAHCTATERCVVHVFGTTTIGSFCFPTSTGAGNACNLTPYSGLTTATTVDGVSASICMLRRTTCAGLADVGDQACDADADCGVDALDDGRCDENAETCSVPCTTSVDCFDPDADNSCLGGQCQL